MMKKSFLCFVLILGPAPLLMTAATVSNTNTAQSAYDQAVQSYVQAATKEVAALRAQADAAVGSSPEIPVKRRFAKAYSQLDECGKLLTELKKAAPADFDRVKARFEQVRGEAIKSLDAAAASKS
jgi:hypothetical protein